MELLYLNNQNTTWCSAVSTLPRGASLVRMARAATTAAPLSSLRLRYVHISDALVNGSRAFFTAACTICEPPPTNRVVTIRPTSVGIKPSKALTWENQPSTPPATSDT